MLRCANVMRSVTDADIAAAAAARNIKKVQKTKKPLLWQRFFRYSS